LGASFVWGAVAASSLVIGALLAFWLHMSKRLIGLIMGFGAGVLISAVAFDLVAEAAEMTTGSGWAISGLFIGCLVFFGGDLLIDKLGGSQRKDTSGKQAEGSPLAIVLGTVLDGIPESLVIGLTIFQGGEVGIAYLAAVFISNLPESISSSTGMVTSGWKKSNVLWMWIGIAVVSGLASMAGFALFQGAPGDVVAFVLCFAAGAIITMLATTMMPEAFENAKRGVGIATTLGFAVAFTIHIVA